MRLELLCELEAGLPDKAFRGRLQGTVWGERLRGPVKMSRRLRRESDGATLRDARGEIRTEDNATIKFSLQGRTVPSDSGGRELMLVLFQTSDEAYTRLSHAVCILEGKF